MGEKTFDIDRLIYAFKKKIWFVLLATIIAGGCGYLKTTKMHETYTAKVKIFSGKTEQITDEYSKGELSEYSSLMNTYIQLIKTNEFMGKVSKKAGLKMPPEQLINGVQFGVTEGVPILEISYTSTEPDASKKIVTTIADEFSSGVGEIILGVHTKVIDEVNVITNYPNKKNVIIFYLAFGILSSLGIIFILDYLDSTIKDKSDLEKRFKAPVIGELPFNNKKSKENEIIIKTNFKNITSESYRKLRTSFEYSSIDKDIKTLVITSSESGEGKSTVCCNFAYVMSQSEKKVLIIDCDLRRPSIHRKLKISNNEGLTNYLIGKSNLKNIINNVCKNLDVITAGEMPPSPADVLGSNKMQEFIREIEEDYDLIILDTPPVRAVTDGQVLAGKVDGTLFLVRAEKTKLDSINKGYKELEKVNANVIGIVINGESVDRKDAYYYGYSKEKK